MRHPRNGFTMIEVVIVLTVGTILTGIAMNAFGGVEGRVAVGQARSTFASLHARARAQAIETGEMTRLFVDTAKDSVWIVRDGEQLETVRFAENFGVDIQASATRIRLCLNPRGFAETSCNSFSTSQTIKFAARSDTASVLMRALGQITY